MTLAALALLALKPRRPRTPLACSMRRKLIRVPQETLAGQIKEHGQEAFKEAQRCGPLTGTVLLRVWSGVEKLRPAQAAAAAGGGVGQKDCWHVWSTCPCVPYPARPPFVVIRARAQPVIELLLLF